MENNEQALKAELYDLGKEVLGLRGFINQVATELGLSGADVTLDNIINKLQTAAVVVE